MTNVEKGLKQYLLSLRNSGLLTIPRSGDKVLESIARSMEGCEVASNESTFSAPLDQERTIEPSRKLGTAPDVDGSDREIAAKEPSSLPAGSPLSPSEKRAQLEILEKEISGCQLCPELVENRTQTVFGTGDPGSRLCFIGEAPGADEDAKGEPFVGAAGQLLTRIINACNLQREGVYILNTLKCRPPNNRNPSEVECANCRPYLDRQLSLLKPEFICCLGGIAAKHLLDSQLSVGRLRGKVHLFQGIKVVVTYHPAYLLRNPDAKRQVWNDMKFLMREMGQPLD